MEKILFGKKFPYQEILKGEEKFLRFELKESDIEKICEETKKRTDGKVDIEFLKNTIKAMNQNRLEGVKFQDSFDVYIDGLKDFLSDFSCKKYGMAYGSKEIQDTEKWLLSATLINNKLEELLVPLGDLGRGVDAREEEYKKLMDLVESKTGYKVTELAMFPEIVFDKDAYNLYDKKIKFKECVWSIAVDVYNANFDSREAVETEIARYNQQVESAKQEIIKIYDEIKIERVKTGDESKPANNEHMNEFKIWQLERKIQDLNYEYLNKITDIKDAQSEKLDDLKDQFTRREKGLEEKISDLKDEVKELKNENKKQNEKIEFQCKEIEELKSENKEIKTDNKSLKKTNMVLGAGVGIIASALFGPPIFDQAMKLKNDFADRHLKNHVIEQRIEQPKLDTIPQLND